MYEEMRKYKKVDFENQKKQTVLINPIKNHENWRISFEKYIDSKYPHLSLKKDEKKNLELKKEKISKKPKAPESELPDVLKPMKTVIKKVKEIKNIYKDCPKRISTVPYLHMIVFGLIEILVISIVFWCFFRKSNSSKNFH